MVVTGGTPRYSSHNTIICSHNESLTSLLFKRQRFSKAGLRSFGLGLQQETNQLGRLLTRISLLLATFRTPTPYLAVHRKRTKYPKPSRQKQRKVRGIVFE